LKSRVFIVHLIRDPVMSADSLVRFFPSLEGDWSRALRMWHKWHRVNAKYADFTMKLEDPFPGFMRIAQILGLTPSVKDVEEGMRVAERGSKGTLGNFTRSVAPQEITDFAREYGYEV